VLDKAGVTIPGIGLPGVERVVVVGDESGERRHRLSMKHAEKVT